MSWTRRLFVRETLKGWLGIVLGPLAYATARGLIGTRSSGQVQSRDIGAADALQPGMSKTVLFGNAKVLIMRDDAGQLHALSGTCTHMGCSVRFDGSRSESHVECNCHESKFSLSGENLSGPATRPLTQYRLENVAGRLILAEAEVRAKRL